MWNATGKRNYKRRSLRYLTTVKLVRPQSKQRNSPVSGSEKRRAVAGRLNDPPAYNRVQAIKAEQILNVGVHHCSQASNEATYQASVKQVDYSEWSGLAGRVS